MKAILKAGLVFGLAGALLCAGAQADPLPRHGFPHGGWHGGWHRGGHGGWDGGWGGGWGGGVIIGGPLFWPYYGPPYPAYPYAPYPYVYGPTVVTPSNPPEYVEQGQDQPAAPPRWYYCKDPKGYYPYVKQCPSGWITVVPPASSPN